MPERSNTNLFEVLIGQVREDREINIILDKRWAYSDRPSFSSQSANCCIARLPADSPRPTRASRRGR
jgi:hypothetical protein